MKSNMKFRAKVLTSWSPEMRTKFTPGETVRVKTRISGESKIAKRYCGTQGRVIAISANDPHIPVVRGTPSMGDTPRGWTRYYVQFGNGQTRGFLSHNLYS